MGEWKFKPVEKADTRVDPIQTEFFRSGEVSDRLVREAIQNSLDAGINGGSDSNEPVRMRFFLSTQEMAVPNEKFNRYLSNLKNHLEADDNGLKKSKKLDLKEPMNFLLIEDFNTTGLTGNPEEHDPVGTDIQNQNFFWFWRNVGRSGKGKDRGRWGVGKTVIPASSEIQTFFALTLRNDDENRFLMGQSVLKIHKTKENQGDAPFGYQPYGFFGEFRDKENIYFASPIDDKEMLDTFEEVFNLERSKCSEPGLSIIIPHPQKSINKSELLRSVLEQYFYPIIQGKLIVTIQEGNSEPTNITGSTIDGALEEINFKEGSEKTKNNFKKLFDFCRWSTQIPLDEYVHLVTPNSSLSSNWNKDRLCDHIVEKILEEKKEALFSGKRVAFRVPLWVRKINVGGDLGRFSVFLEKDEELNKAETHYVRDGITITKIDPGKIWTKLRAIVLIEDPVLAAMLGDAENPSHTEWQNDSENFRDKYVNGKASISYVINSIHRLSNWLMQKAEGEDRDILKDIFPLFIEEPGEDPVEKSPTKKTKGKKTVEPIIDIKNRKPRQLRISKRHDGFEVMPDGYTHDKGDTIEIKVAYEIPKGNAMNKYSPFDFDISNTPIIVETDGLVILEMSENRLRAEILSATFKAEIKGFDSKRDLEVRAKLS